MDVPHYDNDNAIYIGISSRYVTLRSGWISLVRLEIMSTACISQNQEGVIGIQRQ